MLTQEDQIVVRLDANADLGRGHAVRVAALLQALDSPARVCVAGDFDPTDLAQLFPGAEFLVSDAFSKRCQGAALIVVDHPEPNQVPTDVPGLCVVIDDGGQVSAGDLIVNGNAPISRHGYRDLDPATPRLCGMEYALLRPEFAEACRPLDAERSGDVVVAGSGERARRWILELASTPRLWDGDTTFVIGASFPEGERLARCAAPHGIRVRQDLDAAGLASLLATCRVALTTGGMIVPEALAAGACCVAFANEPDLEEELEVLEARGALLSLGASSDVEAVSDAFDRLRTSQALSKSLRKAARECVDGRGVERVAAIIRRMLRERSARS